MYLPKLFIKNFSWFLTIILLSLFLIVNCEPKTNSKTMTKTKQNNTIEQIDQHIQQGNFDSALKLINQLKTDPKTADTTLIDLRFKKDLMRRIKRDFSKTEENVREKLLKYYPQLTDEMLRKWEKSKALEMRVIDGEKRYFYNAVPNLFRIDKEAKKVKQSVDGKQKDNLKEFCLEHTAKILDKYKQENENLINPVKIKFNYNLIVDADAVPDGETIRCWMPFPREDNPRQQNVKLIATNAENYITAPETYKQRSIYMEKIAEAGKPTKFEMQISYESRAEYYDMSTYEIGNYVKDSDFYKKFTSEKAPHIVFSGQIQSLTDSLVAGLDSPYQKVKKIYEYIDKTIPWASALEYSTFWNIPEYVLNNKHGDCGMQSLLLITMLRYAGIPAKWQSGWMMHPGEVNLHDWAEVYYPAIGWVPVDMSFSLQNTDDNDVRYFYTSGIDAYRLIVNDDISTEFYPQKIWPRSETVDFQRGEVEWRGGNLYFDQWDYNMTVEYE
ncbi:MAG: transglutaminase-like domain-containing protein [Fidelibacterota bacterium]